MEDCRFLLVTFPGQGHINPSLQFAKRLAKMGAKVTFSTSLYATRRMTESASLPEGLTISPFSHGYDNGFTKNEDVQDFMSSLITRGSKAMTDLIVAKANEGHPFTHVVYTTLMSWVGQVTNELQVPSTLLWIQPAALFDIYYYYFNGYGDVIRKSDIINDGIELPGLPILLTSKDLPSFLLASNPDLYNFVLPAMKEHIEILEKKENPKILVNTFDALEPNALNSIKHFKMLGIGPLIPSAFLDGNDPNDLSFGGDLRQKSGENYVEWLNSKLDGSVIYVAFGSFSDLPIKQVEEIAEGLIESKRPFLWVMRPNISGEKLEEKLSCKNELENQGLIVPWCSQLEVLSHSSVGCFVTHCGWNSSLESLVFGVPVVSVPLWTDQTTNAKLIQDVWKTGKRVSRNEEDIVESDELRRCIEIVMGSEEMRNNAKKLKELAREATSENGSSNVNLKAFLDEFVDGSTRH